MRNFGSVFGQIKEALQQKGMSQGDINKIEKHLHEQIDNMEPPTIAIIGFTGVGKSSTLNALFQAGQPTDDVKACTQVEKVFRGDLEEYIGRKGTINIYDMPGLGESIRADKHHYEVYARILPKADVIIWTFHAGDRAMTPMQTAIEYLISQIGDEFTNKLMFAINKADAIAPGESTWNEKFNIPSPEQKINLKEAENYVRARVREILPKWNGPVVSYSAKRRYHLEQLMTAMVEVMSEKTRWRLGELADVADYLEMVSPEYREYILSLKAENSK